MGTLKDVGVGKTVKVTRITGEGAIKRRLMDMGLTRGTQVYVRKVAPLGDPMEVTIRGYELSLRRLDVEMIQVEEQQDSNKAENTAAPANTQSCELPKGAVAGRRIRIALVGNPNSGKTTLYNALTGSKQYVGNWPGVTVEKKEGNLKKHENVIITDLPGIYSLSPYTLEEVVARKYLTDEQPEAILNIVDGTNLERNLYLTTQLAELGIPMVIAINMMDVVRKSGDKIDMEALSRKLGCRILEISALNNEGIMEAAEAAIEAAFSEQPLPTHNFAGPVEHAIAHIEEATLHDMKCEKQRWYALKIFERDREVEKRLRIPQTILQHIEQDIAAAEKELDDDAESIIISERYVYIEELLSECYIRHNQEGDTSSDKIDRIVTNRWLGLPILACVMFLVYYISMVAIGQSATDWASDGLFGDGFHLFGVGHDSHVAAVEQYENAQKTVRNFAVSYGTASVTDSIKDESKAAATRLKAMEDLVSEVKRQKGEVREKLSNGTSLVHSSEQLEASVKYLKEHELQMPGPEAYGWWIPGIPVMIKNLMVKMNCAQWLQGLVIDGIVAGVGGVLIFVPQLFVLFFMLAFLEACGYMSRIAFVLDRVFRKFGLSGKSFIPILIGTGCSVPGIMASRTIENQSARRMTIITTSFIPCGAKTPFIAMIAGAIFNNSPWIATGAYLMGIVCIVFSGVLLKRMPGFIQEDTPFVMELPPYHFPSWGNVLSSMWERGWSFVKKAGTIILLFTVLIWFATYFGVVDGSFRMLTEEELNHSVLAGIGNLVAWIFKPLGWGTWQTAVASLTGLVAKENIVGTLEILYKNGVAATADENIALAFTRLSGYSFLVFNLLCAPCVAAMGAIRREMNHGGWTAFAIGYQCVFAYIVSLLIYQVGKAYMGQMDPLWFTISMVILACIIGLLFKSAHKK